MMIFNFQRKQEFITFEKLAQGNDCYFWLPKDLNDKTTYWFS